MTNENEAPERYTFLDPTRYCDMHGEGGPVVADVGESMIPTVTYIRADLSDAQAARIAELEAERDELQIRLDQAAVQILSDDDTIDNLKARAEAAEAKLAKATELAATTGYWVCAETRHATLGLRVEKEIRAALAELKGGE